MSFLGDSEIKEAIEKGEKWIDPFEPKYLKSAAYELGLGGEVFTTDSPAGKPEILNEENLTVKINPGQFALLITSEQVNIPKHRIAFISIKASIKFKGLVNVSGFHVDPGFSGHLLFSVYNAGSATITLRKNERYFPIWFSELKTPLSDNDLYNENENHHQGQKFIRPDYIDTLKSGELASPNVLLKQIKSLEIDFKERLGEYKEKNERVDWLLKSLIVIALSIVIGLVIKWAVETIGDKSQMRSIKEQVNEYVNQATLNAKVDSLVTKKIDSIIESRQRIDSLLYHQ